MRFVYGFRVRKPRMFPALALGGRVFTEVGISVRGCANTRRCKRFIRSQNVVSI